MVPKPFKKTCRLSNTKHLFLAGPHLKGRHKMLTRVSFDRWYRCNTQNPLALHFFLYHPASRVFRTPVHTATMQPLSQGFCILPTEQRVKHFNIQLFRERLSKKNVHATIPKGNMGYDQYTVLDTVAVEVTFAAFLRTCKWPLVSAVLCHSFKFLRRTMNPKPPIISFGPCRVHFFPTDNLSRNSCVFSAYIFTAGLQNLDQFRPLKTINSL